MIELPQELLHEVDLLDEHQRAKLAAICLDTIDLGEEIVVEFFEQMDADTSIKLEGFLSVLVQQHHDTD